MDHQHEIVSSEEGKKYLRQILWIYRYVLHVAASENVSISEIIQLFN